MFRPFGFLSILLLLAPTAGAASDPAERLQADDGSGLYFVSRGGATRVGDAAGARPVALARGADLFDLRATGDGWVAAGGLYTDAGHEMFLLRQSAGEVTPLDAPPSGARLRGNPVLLVADGALAGMAWLEGESPLSQSVRAAARDGDGWGAVEAIEPFRPGTQQVGLHGAVLADGSWLLVWNAFDGEDDELVWARRQEGGWSRPQRLNADNRVPDITVALTPVEGGALAAWSWFDGNDYRLKTARFDGRAWQESEPFGERGSVEPSFSRRGETPWLLYHTVEPGTWSLVEFDRQGFAARNAALADDGYDRPIVGADEKGTPVLSWPGAVEGPPVREEKLEWGTTR